MSTTLLDQVADLEAADAKSRDEAAKEYAKLLRIKKPDAASASRLRELMKVLNLTADNVRMHTAAIDAAAQAEQRLLADTDRQKLADAATDATKALLQARGEWLKREKELQAAANQAATKRSVAEDTDDRARATIERQRRSHPLAFGIAEDVKPVAEPMTQLVEKAVYLGGDFPLTRPEGDYRLVANEVM